MGSAIGFFSCDDATNRIFDKCWTRTTDMSCYTDPKHSDFWQPKWATAEFENFDEWVDAGEPRPWLHAGYDDWNAWAWDGRPGKTE